jgi:hypothetical protein
VQLKATLLSCARRLRFSAARLSSQCSAIQTAQPAGPQIRNAEPLYENTTPYTDISKLCAPGVAAGRAAIVQCLFSYNAAKRRTDVGAAVVTPGCLTRD